MGVYIFNLASVVVCVSFLSTTVRLSISGWKFFTCLYLLFIVDLPTGNSGKISDAAYLLAVSISFAVCSGTSMSWIKTY